MLDDIIEFLLDIILEGVMIATEVKEVPASVRIFLTGMLLGVLLAISGLLLWIGINSRSVALSVLSAILLIVMIVLIGKKIREYKKNLKKKLD